jgi:hypothetical protein
MARLRDTDTDEDTITHSRERHSRTSRGFSVGNSTGRYIVPTSESKTTHTHTHRKQNENFFLTCSAFESWITTAPRLGRAARCGSLSLSLCVYVYVVVVGRRRFWLSMATRFPPPPSRMV